MTKVVLTLAGSLMVAVLSASSNAQQPSRDTATVAGRRGGAGIIQGTVTLGDDAGTPVQRAVVTLTAANGGDILATISGDDGRFIFEHVPAGRYALKAKKPAHLTVAYGARRPGRRGTTLVVASGQRITDLVLTLPRGGVLAGRLSLANGQPAPDIRIFAIPSQLAVTGGTPVASTREFRTDDLGEFRLFGLTPDTYLVAALPSFGRGEVELMPEGLASALLRQLEQPIGNSLARAGSPMTVAYAPVYFPGTPSVADALRITVATGQVIDGLNFTIMPFPAATIRGRVVNAHGAPTQAVALSLETVGPDFPVASLDRARVDQPNGNGEFQIVGVSPGLYRLRARSGGVSLGANDATASIRPAAQTQYAVAEVGLSGQDLDGIVLVLQEGRRFAGRISADDSAASPSWTGVSVVIRPIAKPTGSLVGVLQPGVPSREGIVDPVGRFVVTGIEPSEYQISVSLPPTVVRAGWHIDSIRHAGHDLRDAPLTFSDGSLEEVDIRLTTTITELAGRLTTESGTPATDYVIVAFPADRLLWHATSPRVRILRPAVDGTFSTQELPAGMYRLAVLTDVEEDELRQAMFLESVYEASIGVALVGGQATRQDMRIGGRSKRH